MPALVQVRPRSCHRWEAVARAGSCWVRRRSPGGAGFRQRSNKLEWRQADTVLNMTDVPRRAVTVDGHPSYPDLARVVSTEYTSHGVHRSPTDPKPDLAVLHADNATSYGELIAVMDAMYATTKQHDPTTGTTRRAFNVAFAVD